MNLYGFAGGDPVNFSDPFGLCPDGPEKCSWFGNFFAGVHAGAQGLANAPAGVDQNSGWYSWGKATGAAMSGMSGMLTGASAASLDPQSLSGRENLTGTDKQFGHKFARHKDSQTPGYRTPQEYRARANEIFNDPNAIRTTFPGDAPLYRGETHIQSGSDLLRLDPQGQFRSMYRVP